MNISSPLRSFVIMLLGALVIAVVTGASYYNYKLIQDQVIQRDQKQLLTIARTVAESLESFFAYRGQELASIATNRTFQEELTQLDSENPPVFQSLDDYFLIQKDQIEMVAYFTAEGVPVYSVPSHMLNQVKLTAYGTNQISKGLGPVVGSVYREGDGSFINILQPVWSGEKQAGFLMAKIDLDTVYKKLVQPVKVGEKGYASVKDSRGVLLMHPNREDIGRNVLDARKGEYPDFDWSELEALVALQLQKEAGVGIYHSLWFTDNDQKRVKKFNAFSPADIGQDFWTVNVSMDYVEATEFLRERTYTIIIINFTILIIFITVMIYIYRIRRDKREYQKEAVFLREVSRLNQDLEADIEKRKALEAQLFITKEKYKNIFNSGSDGMLMVSLDEDGMPGEILEVNEKACRVLGQDRKALIGKRYSAIGTADLHCEFGSEEEALHAGDTLVFQDHFRISGGGLLPVEIHARLMSNAPDQRLVMNARDITARIQQEEAVRRSEERFRAIVNQVASGIGDNSGNDIYLAEKNGESEATLEAQRSRTALELEQLNIKLEQMFQKELDERQRNEALMIYQSRLAAMGEMIGNIAHQWRQPLGGLGMIFINIRDLLEELSGEKTELDDAVKRGELLVQRMSQTIDDFMFFFNPRTEPTLFLVSSAVDMTLEFMRDVYRLNSITTTVEIERDGLIFGHVNQLSQVLQAVLQNAQEAIAEKDAADRRVHIAIFSDGANARIEICDTGGGIAADQMHKIFEPGFTTKGSEKGTGVGLYLSKVIIEKNFGGVIDAAPCEKGLCIRLNLPEGRDGNGRQ